MADTSESKRPQVLIIDDNRLLRETMKRLVDKMDCECHVSENLAEGLKLLNNRSIDVVFLDVCLPDGNGIEHIDDIRRTPSEPDVIMLTGETDPDRAELSIQKGVIDYLVKPISFESTLKSLGRALTYRAEKRLEKDFTHLDMSGVVGSSPVLGPCFETVAQAAKTDSNVLITGETGTGKELFARVIHTNSRRVKAPFVIVDCASLTKSLVESILFGHRKGAFTGATSDRTGLVESAHKGTLFLDEIGELPLSIQKTFLRVLQEKRFRPVGDTREVSSDFRLIAATNKNLQAMVQTRAFRQDLLFRLATVTLDLPPLRKRREDIPDLADFHIRELCARYSYAEKTLDPDALSVLCGYSWPGNVRQLFNALERSAIASGKSSIIRTMDLPQEIRIEVTRSVLEKKLEREDLKRQLSAMAPVQNGLAEPGAELFDGKPPGFKAFKNSMEKKYLEEIIRRTGNDIRRILEISGLSRSHYYALLKKNNIDPDTGEGGDTPCL